MVILSVAYSKGITIQGPMKRFQPDNLYLKAG